MDKINRNDRNELTEFGAPGDRRTEEITREELQSFLDIANFADLLC
jgi:hypothetical protein